MKIKVAVLFGGRSVEHEVSVISAIQAISNMDRGKYDIIPVYITKNNEFYTGEDVGDIDAYKNIPKLIGKSDRVIFINEGNRCYLTGYPSKIFGKKTKLEIDLAFPIVHGTNAEDGTLQGYLKMFNIPYVGCDVLSSAVGMDKYVMKTVLKDNGIPVLDCVCINQKDYNDEQAAIKFVEDRFKYPVIIKPVNLGSSVGISKAYDREGLKRSIENAFVFAGRILIEPAVEQLKEVNCSVAGSCEDAEASVCEEPINSDEILSYKDKYIGGGKGDSKGMASTQRKIPADITAQQTEAIRQMAVKAFKCLGCNGVSRIDFMIDKANGNIYLNEINTIPGSLAFYLWEPAGLSYRELLDKIIKSALDRHRKEQDITYSFDTNILSMDRRGGKKGGKL